MISENPNISKLIIIWVGRLLKLQMVVIPAQVGGRFRKCRSQFPPLANAVSHCFHGARDITQHSKKSKKMRLTNLANQNIFKPMTKLRALDHLTRLFGKQCNVAKVARRSAGTVSAWRRTGVPLSAVHQIAQNAHEFGVSITREQIFTWIHEDEQAQKSAQPCDRTRRDSPAAKTCSNPTAPPATREKMVA